MRTKHVIIVVVIVAAGLLFRPAYTDLNVRGYLISFEVARECWLQNHNWLMSSILSFLLPMLATIPVTGMICRIRIARKRPISYGTLLMSACSIPLLVAFIATCIQPDMWWSREHKAPLETVLATFGYMAAMCILPALGVVIYYQRRSKRDEKSVA